MFLVWLISTVGLCVWIYKLQKRLKALEASPLPATMKLAKTTGQTASPTAEVNPFIQDDAIDRSKWPQHLKNQPNSVATAATKTPPKVEKSFDLEQFLGQKLFPILGATSIVIAIGFFAIWAFANGWVGPMGRIAIGILVSLGLMGLGETLKQKYPHFFTILVATGLAGLIITTLIAHYAYDFISAVQTLMMLALQAGVGVLLSLRYDSRVLANFSIAAGLLAPWFTAQLDPMLVLPFVLVLTLAGFALAVQKKWPEIFVGLLILGSSYVFAAVARLSAEILERDREFREALTHLGEGTINPFVLLGFAAVIYGLIASAGIIRLMTHYKDKEPPTEESGEMVIFSSALLLFNLCAVGVFSAQGWSHIGFLVLIQAAGLLLLAEWFKAKSWKHFHQLTLSTSLLFIILATLWELRNVDTLILTMALTIEGTLMCSLGQLSKQKIYEWFGRITLVLAYAHFSSFAIDNTDILLQSLLTFTFVTAFIYSVGRPKVTSEKIWLGFSLFLSSILIFDLSFDKTQFIPAFLAPTLPALWALALSYGAYHFSSRYLRIAASLVFVSFTIVTINQSFANDALHLLAWGWILLASVPLFLLRTKATESATFETFMGYTVVLMTSFSWIYVTANTLNEPLLTLSWLALVGGLMTLGLRFKSFKELRYVGLGWMLFIVAKLYLVDVWQWDTPIRVVAFTALGGALLAIGFFYQKIWLKK